jgi:putative SOS response-associated peptidase YedK
VGKRHEHRKSDAQRSVGDRDNDTGISRFDPYQTLPHTCGWILRVAKNGICEAALRFEVGEGEVFAFAGLWDEWRSPDGEIIESCTVLTTGPNSLVADLHDRMPVIVTADKYDVWLDPDVNDFKTIRDILKPYDANLMRRYPVSRKLNNSRIDDAEAASPVTLDTPTQGQLF